MEDLANRASELEALVGEEREGRAAAERRAESSERALEQRCCNDDESFEAVLVADLAAMRESYEAKLAAAHAAAREESAVHRRELKTVNDARDLERRASEARMEAAMRASRPSTPRGLPIGLTPRGGR
uniref:Uncharacterized protein n=1 Tax=Haptolina ericina TaxID=156174 RepID=A0A7S3BWQ1_9EUKA